MSKTTVYVSKDNLANFLIHPKPKDELLENYYITEVDEEFINTLPLHYVYDPEKDSFVPCVERYNKRVISRRKQAYEKEADPLYKEWQFESSIGSDKAEEVRLTWLAKIEEIKQRHPKAETL